MDSLLFIVNCKVPAALCSLPNWCKDFHQSGNRALIMLSIKCFFKIALASHQCKHCYMTTCILIFQKGKCLWSTHLIFFFATIHTQLKREMKVGLKEGGLCEFHFDSACVCIFILLATHRSIIPYLQWQNPQSSGKWSYKSLPVKSVLNTWM